jgi:starch phosphorylase
MSTPDLLHERLRQLALNLWWTWQPELIELFRAIDPEIWRQSNHNPIVTLQQHGVDGIAYRVDALALRGRIEFWSRRLEEYLASDDTWCAAEGGALSAATIAYFSAEFGIHESLPLYSGGLGILAGDHLKSASDLGLPMVGVGLFYAQGYFHQRLNASGWQEETYGKTDVDTLPLVRAADSNGEALTIDVQCGRDTLRAAVWLAHVGRTRLLLLDSDVAGNTPGLRELTAALYGGDELTRIRQEILLGIGGLRALRRLGLRPTVLHLNEGHSAFAILERMRERVEEDGLSFDEALRGTAVQTVFTTHTPVAAGHDRFVNRLLDDQLGWMAGALKVDPPRWAGLGRVDERNTVEPFTMTVLGLKGARHRNAVSHLHGHVSRRMWNSLWPSRAEEDVPIGHVTNGVHVTSWLAPSMARYYERRLGADWAARQGDPVMWDALTSEDGQELWEIHNTLRRKLVAFAHRRSGSAATLDPDALTIGFARRFATYKRATLIFSDLERLAQLCGRRDRPMQIVFAGKAHPRDDAGKQVLQQIVALTRDSRFAGRVVFLEDYDINVARHLVQGVDLWLNTPLRPLEASGTSGQKAALNGVLNLSILDGWWAEAFDGLNGFAIGTTPPHADATVQWSRDAAALYDMLEREAIPVFFDRDHAALPRRWVERMKRSIVSLSWRFTADRMVLDYARTRYGPAAGSMQTAG